MIMLPLSGIRVIDVTHHVAGPYCTKLFADLGADVVKIEKPGAGDEARLLRPFVGAEPHLEKSAVFLHLNTNKRSVILDLKSKDGVNTLKELVKDADILVENYRPGKLAELGIGYPVLERINPALVMTSISNFGQDGPYRDWEATELTLNALSGMMLMTGNPGKPPVKLGLSQVQCTAGVAAAIATLAAHRYSKMTGYGQYIDISLLESFFNMLHQQTSRYTYMGWLQERGAVERFPWIFSTKDGWVHVSQLQIRAVVDYLKHFDPRLNDAKFVDPTGWQEHLPELGAILKPWFAQKGKLEIAEEFQLQGINASPVYDEADLLRCPQMTAREFFDFVDHPLLGRGTITGRYFVSDQIPRNKPRPAPALGEHTIEITGEIGKHRKPAANSTPETPHVDTNTMPLAGIRILSTEHWAALPHMTKYLASLGAEVIVVESPSKPPGDPATRGAAESGGLFIEGGRNKLGATIDLSKPKGVELFKRLVKISDAVVDNFTPRVMKGFGLDYEELKKVKPDVITLSISGFGHKGPWHLYRGYSVTAEATSGLANLTGYPDANPVRPGGTPPGDMIPALHAAFALLAAIEYRNRTGKGAELDVSMIEPITCQLGEAIVNYSYTGKKLERTGNRDRDAAPSGCYPCRGDDKWVTVTACNDRQWKSLAALIGRPSLAENLRFGTVGHRQQYHDEVDSYISDWTRTRDNMEVMEQCQQAGIAAGAVLHVREVLTDKQNLHRGSFEVVQMPSPPYGVGKRLHIGPPWKLSRTPASTKRPARIGLGEDNDYVFRTLLGIGDGELRDLESEGIIGRSLLKPLEDRGRLPLRYNREEGYLETLGLK